MGTLVETAAMQEIREQIGNLHAVEVRERKVSIAPYAD
jgi:hypothetical protein